MVHVVLAIEQRLYRELLASHLARENDVRVVARVWDEFEVAAALEILLGEEPFSADDPVVVITSIDDVERVPAFCSRLLGEFPEVIVIGICWNCGQVRTFQASIDVQELPCTLDSLVAELRAMTRRPSPW